jgi:hypothetical protein
MNDDGLDIPEFLQVKNRVKLTAQQAIRMWATIEIANRAGDRWHDLAEHKRERRRTAAARREAKKARDLARQADSLATQPLTGKAALAAIRSKAATRRASHQHKDKAAARRAFR